MDTSDTFRFDDGVLVIAGKRYPWAEVSVGDVVGTHLEFHIRKAFMPFENGWGLSVIWSTGSYTANHLAWLDEHEFLEEVPAAELAVYFRDEMITVWPGGDVVEGYVPAVLVRDTIIPLMMGWPSNLDEVLRTARWADGLRRDAPAL